MKEFHRNYDYITRLLISWGIIPCTMNENGTASFKPFSCITFLSGVVIVKTKPIPDNYILILKLFLELSILIVLLRSNF